MHVRAFHNQRLQATWISAWALPSREFLSVYTVGGAVYTAPPVLSSEKPNSPCFSCQIRNKDPPLRAVFSEHTEQFPSWCHKTVPQRSGHSFEARSSGASSHFVPLHHDPATRSRCRSEETPRPAKRPRRKAGARAKRGVSELCHVNTMDQFPRWRHKPVTQRKRSQV